MQQINTLIAPLINAMTDCAAHRAARAAVAEDLGRLANAYEPRLPRAFRVPRLPACTARRARPLLVMFQSDYVRRLIEMEVDAAAARLPEIRRFPVTTHERDA